MADRPAITSGQAALGAVLTLWSMPVLLGQAWLAGCLTATARKDDGTRNPRGGRQLPVPGVIQDTKDRGIHA